MTISGGFVNALWFGGAGLVSIVDVIRLNRCFLTTKGINASGVEPGTDGTVDNMTISRGFVNAIGFGGVGPALTVDVTVVHVIAVMYVIADPPKNLTTIISRRYLDGSATKSKIDFEKRVEQNSLTIEFLLYPDIIWEKSEIRRRW
jgi:hypothetical protein